MNAVSLDTDYLKGIAENDYTVLQQIYNESLPEVAKYVKRNSGTFDDAKDVFQEGILVVFRKVQENTLQLTTSLHIYLFSVCRNIWLRKLKRKGNREVTVDEIMELGFEEDLDANFIKSQKWKLFNNKFKMLAEECRKVLQMLFDGISGKEIASRMGYTEDYAKRKKYKCKNGLADLIKKAPEYKYLIEK
jgi:RNA polymerase sigma factor (sigma-70 family)